MAEALAIVGLVSAIIQFIGFSSKVVKRLDEFHSFVDDVPKSLRHIKTELPLIIDTLRRTKDQAQFGDVEKATAEAVVPVIEECQLEVKLLDEILEKIILPPGASSWERRKKALLSLNQDKKVEEIAESLGKYMRLLTFHQATEVSKPKPKPNKPTVLTLIPFDRNAHFVDREEIFDKIDNVFDVKEGSQPKAALCGLGGVGKSQIALEYCYRRKKRFPECSIFWVHAGNAARFEETYKRIATECGILVREDAQTDVMQLVRNWLESTHQGVWFMVVDNVDDANIYFRERTHTGKTISQYIPKYAGGPILYTTRSRDIGADLALPAKPIVVPAMTVAQGRLLLGGRIDGRSTVEELSELLEELEYLPLSITQAAAFMARREKTILQYLDLCRKSDSVKIRLLSYEFSDHGRAENTMESVAKTWTISFESIRTENPRATNLLSLMSYLDRQAIPLSLLENKEEDFMDFEDAVAVLLAFSLIVRNGAGDSFDMHRLVQLATRWWLARDNKGGEEKWASEALELLALRFPFPKHEDWTLCASLLPHAEMVLQYKFKISIKENELARATLLLHTSRYLHDQGAYSLAETRAEESFLLRERILGEKHPDTLGSLSHLVWTLGFRGKFEKSEEMGRRLVKLREEVLGKEHPETIDSRSDVANALHYQGKHEEAEIMQREALEMSERVLGREHPDTLTCLHNLASVLEDLGKLQEAEEKQRLALTLREKVLGKEHPHTLSSLHQLAGVIMSQGRYREAERIYRHALGMWEKVVGKKHPQTLVSLHSLAAALQSQGKNKGTEKMLRSVLKGEEAVLGRDHPHTWQAMHSLAMTLRDRGDYLGAEILFKEKLKAQVRTLGPEQKETLLTARQLSSTLKDQGKYDEAARLDQRLAEAGLLPESPESGDDDSDWETESEAEPSANQTGTTRPFPLMQEEWGGHRDTANKIPEWPSKVNFNESRSISSPYQLRLRHTF